jgi:hypothetical protein
MMADPSKGLERPLIRSRTSTTFSPREKANKFWGAVAPPSPLGEGGGFLGAPPCTVTISLSPGGEGYRKVPNR